MATGVDEGIGADVQKADEQRWKVGGRRPLANIDKAYCAEVDYKPFGL